jgi:teichoic acid transport system permease protein
MPQTAVADSGTGLTLKELAARNGLHSAAALPSLPAYLREIWSYRHFITSYSNAKITSSLGQTRLGMLWQVLTPMFNAAVYYVIFGLLLNTSRDVKNFIPYLCIGVFLFGFTQTVTLSGISSITGGLGLIRALHFPRAALPISVVLIELRNMVASMSVLIVIVLVTGEPVTLEWLLVAPILLVQATFNLGLAMLGARLGSKLIDIRQIVPFFMRVWMYGSAVLYTPARFAKMFEHHPTLLAIVESNPLLIYIELMRHALMEDVKLVGPLWELWLKAIAWAVIAFSVGFVYFWRGEKGYGRG